MPENHAHVLSTVAKLKPDLESDLQAAFDLILRSVNSSKADPQTVIKVERDVLYCRNRVSALLKIKLN